MVDCRLWEKYQAFLQVQVADLERHDSYHIPSFPSRKATRGNLLALLTHILCHNGYTEYHCCTDGIDLMPMPIHQMIYQTFDILG